MFACCASPLAAGLIPAPDVSSIQKSQSKVRHANQCGRLGGMPRMLCHAMEHLCATAPRGFLLGARPCQSAPPPAFLPPRVFVAWGNVSQFLKPQLQPNPCDGTTACRRRRRRRPSPVTYPLRPVAPLSGVNLAARKPMTVIGAVKKSKMVSDRGRVCWSADCSLMLLRSAVGFVCLPPEAASCFWAGRGAQLVALPTPCSTPRAANNPAQPHKTVSIRASACLLRCLAVLQGWT